MSDPIADDAPVVNNRPPLFAIAAFSAFVLGGAVFAGVFLANWSALANRPEPPQVVMSAGPVRVTMPVKISPSASSVAQSKPADSSPAAQVTTGLVNVVKTVLPDWPGTDRVTILLLGVDKRDDEPMNGARSDTIMLASIDPQTRSAALVSLPRDMWVRIPGFGPQRINVAHAVGGPDATRQTIVSDFGIPIQYYARVDFRGFQRMIDAMGGVIIDVDAPVKDDEYPTDDYGYQRLYFAPGPQLMDGHTALQFARSRHGSNDFVRAGRQQQVLTSLRRRALQLDTLSKAPELVEIAQSSLSTDLSAVEMLELAKLMSQVDQDKIARLVVDATYATPFVGPDGADLLQPNIVAIRRAIEATERVAAHPELKAKIEVLNGSGTVGLGQKAADYLAARGFNVVRIASAERNDYRSSLVQVLTDDRPAAEALASMLSVPMTAISDLPTPNATADIRIVVGQDFRLPPNG